MTNKVKIIGGHRAGKTISALQEFYEHGKKGSSIVLRSPGGDFVSPVYLKVLIDKAIQNTKNEINNKFLDKARLSVGCMPHQNDEWYIEKQEWNKIIN